MDTIILQFGDDETPARAAAEGLCVPSLGDAANIGLAFFDIARSRGDHPAVETEKGTFTYGWLLRAAESVRRYLRSRPDFAPGARVALKLANSPDYVAAYYGTLLADGVVVPLPVALEPMRLKQIEETCRPDILIAPKNLAGEAAATVTLIAESSGDIARPALQRGRGDLAMLLFTSGSTGLPKGVMLSHGNILSNTQSILHDLPVTADDRALVLLPFCHAFGNSILQTHMLAGATMVFAGALMFPATISQAIAKFDATSFSAVPEVYGMLMKYGGLGEQKMSHLRYMSVAGGQLRHDLAVKISELIAPAAFYVMYGQSEAAARLAVLPPDQLHGRAGSIGRALAGVELAVLDENNRTLPPDEIGMLCARGPNVMLGYWQDETGTREALRDGWLRTGDLARADADGYFYIAGRANLLVKVQGYRVHPVEIESVVEAAFPGVRAVALPMQHAGETRFALFVAPQGGAAVDLAVLRAACQRDLPSYKIPVLIEILEELPLTSGYKVDRAALSRRLPLG